MIPFSLTRSGRRRPTRIYRLAGLKGSAEVLLDRWGIPHIYAHSELDAFFAEGFMHARERLFQMEVSRRAARGRLSEVFGRKTLVVDRFFRRVGLHRAAEAELPALDDATRAIFEAYTIGVNAGARSRSLPLEFRLLRTAFAPWELLDSLAFGRLMAWNLSTNWDAELARAQLVGQLGPEGAALVEPRFSELHPTVVGMLPAAMRTIEKLSGEFEVVQQALGQSRGGSNAWAIAPTRTASGRPLLANDPHLNPQLPSTWYEAELSAPDLHVTGATLAGLPGVMIGHNERIGWGITASMVDVQDLVVVEPARLGSAERRRESIAVRGERPVIEEVIVTEFGPVLERCPDGGGLVLKTTVLDETPMAPAILGIMRASDWGSFQEAASRFVAPSLGYTYADVEGNIGFQLAGRVPRRRGAMGYLPSPAGDPRFEWQGYLSFEELPCEFNPAAGILVNANNQIERGPELAAPGEFVDGYRAARIARLLGDRRRLTMRDCEEMQADVYAVHAEELLEATTDWRPLNPRLRDLLDALRRWDRVVSRSSPEAAVFEAFFLRLMWNVLRHRIGDLATLYLGRPSHGLGSAPPLCLRVASLVIGAVRAGSPWFADGSEREALLNRSLEDARRELSARMGADRTKWSWGALHRITFRHALGSIPGLGRLLNRGPLPMPGDMHTVLQAAYLTYQPYDVLAWAPSYRQVLDVGEWGNSRSMHAPGQSGRVGGRHYADLIRPWHAVTYHPMTFSREAVRRHVERTIALAPG